MIKILSPCNIPQEPFFELPDEYEIMFPPADVECFSDAEIEYLIPEFDVLVSMFTQKIDNHILDKAKNLKLIANYGAGYNGIDVKYAKEKGILVCNSPDAVSFPTAELAMSLMLAVNRRIVELDKTLRKSDENIFGVMKNIGNTLQNKTLGIIGMGKIGKILADMASSFAMKIAYYNRNTVVEQYQRMDFDEVLKNADVISLHTPLNDSTRHLIDFPQFEMMKNDAILINTSRGAVVNEVALVDALQNGKIRAAGLDVYENEPEITPNLLKLDNVVLVPHIGSGTIECRYAISREVAENIRNFFAGNPTKIVS